MKRLKIHPSFFVVQKWQGYLFPLCPPGPLYLPRTLLEFDTDGQELEQDEEGLLGEPEYELLDVYS